MVVPGLKDVVQGSTCATSSRPRVSACSSFSCFPDEPRKMRGLSIRSSRQQVGAVARCGPLRPNDAGTRGIGDGLRGRVSVRDRILYGGDGEFPLRSEPRPPSRATECDGVACQAAAKPRDFCRSPIRQPSRGRGGKVDTLAEYINFI